MRTQTICLMSGHTSTGDLKDIDREMLDRTENKKVVVLNLSHKDTEKLVQKHNFLQSYFTELGASQTNSLFPNTDSPVAKDLVRSADLLYLPGGDTELLNYYILENGLESTIRNFLGVISGNSGGAYVLSKGHIKIRNGNTEIIETTGIAPVWVKAHYHAGFDSILRELSKERDIYGLTDSSALVFNEGVGIRGDVFLFSKEGKQKLKK